MLGNVLSAVGRARRKPLQIASLLLVYREYNYVGEGDSQLEEELAASLHNLDQNMEQGVKRRLSDVLQKKHEPSTEKGTRGSKKPGFVYLSLVRMFWSLLF